VLNIVDHFDQVEAHNNVAKVEFQRFPAEEIVNTAEDRDMDNLIPDHFVVEESC